MVRFSNNAVSRPAWRSAGVTKLMALCRCSSLYHCTNKPTHCLAASRLKRPARIRRSVFQGLEQRFRIGIIVADCRTTKRRRDAQCLQGSQHRGAFHRIAVVRMQYHLIRFDGFSCANITHNIARQLTAFRIINLPADNFPAKNIHEQIQVTIDALHRCRQVSDVPTEQLIGRGGAERTWFVTALRGSFGTPMPEQVLGSQDRIER